MKNIENTDSADFREERSRIFARVLDRYSDDPYLDAPEDRLDLFRSLGSDEFITGIRTVNRLIIKNHDQDQANNFFTERTNAIASPNDPDLYQGMSVPEDKEPLLEYLYDYCCTLASKPDETIEHIAAVLGYGINTIHPFTDGNGRTARASYNLLTQNPAEWPSSLKESSMDEERIADRLNPARLRDIVYTGIKYTLQTHDFDQDEPHPRIPIAMLDSSQGPWSYPPKNREEGLNDRELLVGIMYDKDLSSMIPARLVDTHNSPAIEKAVLDHMGQAVFCIDVFAQEASQADMEQLRHTYREIVNMYFGNLIDLIAGEIDSPIVHANTVESGLIATDIPSLMTNIASGKLTIT